MLHRVTEKEKGCEGRSKRGHIVKPSGERAGMKLFSLQLSYSFALSPPPPPKCGQSWTMWPHRHRKISLQNCCSPCSHSFVVPTLFSSLASRRRSSHRSSKAWWLSSTRSSTDPTTTWWRYDVVFKACDATTMKDFGPSDREKCSEPHKISRFPLKSW